MRRLGWLILVVLGACASAQEWVSETLQGRGVVGPYTLSWNQIVEGSEIVLVGEQWLVRERDYSIDYAKGHIQFAKPLAPETIARVGYRIQLGRSQQNRLVDLVLSAELGRLGAMSLSMEGRVRSGRGTPQADLGIRATTEQPNQQAEVFYLLRNPLSANPSALLRFGSQWRTHEGLTLQLLFSRADTAFGDARPYGLVSGQEQGYALLDWRPDQHLRARLLWRQQRMLQNPLHAQQHWLAGVEFVRPTASLHFEQQMSDQSSQPASFTERLALSLKPHEQVRLRFEERASQHGEQTRSQTEARAEIGQAMQLSHQTRREGEQHIEESRVALQGGTRHLHGKAEWSQRRQQAEAQGAAQLQMQAQLHPTLQIGGEYQAQGQAAQLWGYQLTATPLSGLRLQLRERTYEGWSGYQLRSQQLEWEWRTPQALTFGGQFARHPLLQGRPQPTQLEGYRLRYQRGGWSLELGYQAQEQLAQTLLERRYQLSLQSQLNPTTLFALTLQGAEWERDAFLREVALKLGLTQRLQNFYLMLEASAHLPRADQNTDPNRPRYGGSLKLGVQF